MKNPSATILLGIAFGAGGCHCGTTVIPCTAPLVVMAPGSMLDLAQTKSFSFGAACIGSPKSVTFTLSSGSECTINVNPSDVMISGAGFTLEKVPSGPFALPQDITVGFNPSMTAGQSGSITISKAENADNVPLTIALTGIGTNGADQPIFDTVCPFPGGGGKQDPCNSLTFANVVFGTTATLPITIFNDGGCPPFTVDSVTFADGGGPFSLPGLALPQSIDPTTPYDLMVGYAPSCATSGCTTSFDVGMLLIHTTNGFDGDAGMFPVTLHGNGIAPIVRLIGPGDAGTTTCQRFSRDGGYAYEREPVTLTFTITNGAVAEPVVVGPASIDAGNLGFTIVPGRCWTPISPAELLPDGGISLPSEGSSATCDVQFDVANADPANQYPPNGFFSASLLAPYTALGSGFTASICLLANSAAKACWTPPSSQIDLPMVSYCGAAAQDIPFYNCGSEDLVVSSIDLGPHNFGGSFSLDLHGHSFPETWIWEDGGAVVTVAYNDDGGATTADLGTEVVLSSTAPDGGAVVVIQAHADPVCPTPDTLTPQVQWTGTGQVGKVYEVDVTPSTCPAPYSLGWYYQRDGGIIDAGELLLSDGGNPYAAYLTPMATGIYNVCVDVNELPLDPPLDGGNCHLHAQNCTPDFRVP